MNQAQHVLLNILMFITGFIVGKLLTAYLLINKKARRKE